MTDHDLLWHCLGSRDGFHALTRIENGSSYADWIPVENRLGFLHHFALYPQDVQVGAVPCLDFESHLLHGDASVLWCRVETGESARRLERFMPRPTLVLRDGECVKRTCLWALRQPLDSADTERANKRIAHRLGAAKKHAAPSFRFHAPGTIVTHGRSKPLPIVVEERTDELYPVGVITKRLPDAPEPRDWRRAA